jgi:sec-independent protein translocase protein TatA
MNLVPAQRIGVNMLNPLVGMPQGAEWLIILAIVILVFGAAKLPDLARSSGQALRIFKAETKGLREGDKKDTVEGKVVNDDKPEETR